MEKALKITKIEAYMIFLMGRLPILKAMIYKVCILSRVIFTGVSGVFLLKFV